MIPYLMRKGKMIFLFLTSGNLSLSLNTVFFPRVRQELLKQLYKSRNSENRELMVSGHHSIFISEIRPLLFYS